MKRNYFVSPLFYPLRKKRKVNNGAALEEAPVERFGDGTAPRGCEDVPVELWQLVFSFAARSNLEFKRYTWL